MKKKWRSRLKQTGIALLLAIMLAEKTSSYAYAGIEFTVAEEQKEAAKEEDREDTEITEKIEGSKKEESEEIGKNSDPEKSEEPEKEENEKNTENKDAKEPEENTDIENDGNEKNQELLGHPDGEAREDTKEEQYHFRDGDVESIQEWMRRYLPGGYEDIRSLKEEWWEALYDYERDLAEFIQGSLAELDPNAYWGQTLEEVISILEQGVSPNVFFQGTLLSV